MERFIERKIIEELTKKIDTNNPKPELNCLYADKENLVSTDTRALVAYKHDDIDIDESFLVHGDLLRHALKDRKAKFFELEHMSVHVFDKESSYMFSVQNKYYSLDIKYPDYKRIILNPSETKEVVKFAENSHIQGILSLRRIHVLNKYLPNCERGKIHINEKNLPVMIEDADRPIKTVLMPVVDTFDEF